MNVLNKVMKWTTFILAIVAIILLLFVPIFCLIYLPNTTIAKQFSSTIEYVSIFITFLSAGFGAFSIYQATASSKQATRIIDKINRIDNNQKLLDSKVSMIGMMIEKGNTKDTKGSEEYNGWLIDHSDE